MTLISLVLGGAIFIGVYNMWASFDKVIEDIQGYFLADINSRSAVTTATRRWLPWLRVFPAYPVWKAGQNILALSSSDKDSAGTQIMFVAPPSTSTLIDPVITGGRWLETGDENAVVIGNHLLRIFPNLKIGDTLTIEIDGKETTWHIIGFYTITGNVGSPLLYVNYEYLSHLVGLPGQVYSLRVLTTEHDAATQERVNDQLTTFYEAHGIQVGQSQLGADFIEAKRRPRISWFTLCSPWPRSSPLSADWG